MNDLKKSLIPFAGIFLACIICAGIPAVAAAENQNSAFNAGSTIKPAETAQLWYAPITGLFGMNQQTDNAGHQDSVLPVNATSGQPGSATNWWENLFPSEWGTQNPKQDSVSPIQTTTPEQNPASAPETTQNPAPVITQSPDPAQPANPSSASTPSTPSNLQKPNSPVQKTP